MRMHSVPRMVRCEFVYRYWYNFRCLKLLSRVVCEMKWTESLARLTQGAAIMMDASKGLLRLLLQCVRLGEAAQSPNEARDWYARFEMEASQFEDNGRKVLWNYGVVGYRAV